MMDVKAVTGTIATALAGSASWLDIAEPIVTMTVTIIVGGATLWYTIERALLIRRERMDGNKEDSKPTGSDGSNDRSVGDS